MNLIVKIVDAPAVPGGKAFMLCDERGEALPMQSHAVLDQGVDSATIMVEFHIDGDKVRIE